MCEIMKLAFSKIPQFLILWATQYIQWLPNCITEIPEQPLSQPLFIALHGLASN
jgi:hypothetical protein